MHQPDCDKVSLERGGPHHECLRHARPRARADGQTAGTTKRRRRGGSPRWAAPPRRPVPRFTGKEEARALNRTDEGVSGIRGRLATLTTEARPGVVTPQAGPPHPGGPGGQGSARAEAGPARGAAPGTSPSERGPQGHREPATPRPPRLQTPLTPRSPDQSRRRPWGCTVKAAPTGDQRVLTRRTRSPARRPPSLRAHSIAPRFPGSARAPRDLALPGGPGLRGQSVARRRAPRGAPPRAGSGHCRTPRPARRPGGGRGPARAAGTARALKVDRDPSPSVGFRSRKERCTCAALHVRALRPELSADLGPLTVNSRRSTTNRRTEIWAGRPAAERARAGARRVPPGVRGGRRPWKDGSLTWTAHKDDPAQGQPQACCCGLAWALRRTGRPDQLHSGPKDASCRGPG